MQSFNRVQNRPQRCVILSSASARPTHFEKLEQRTLFDGSGAMTAEDLSNSSGAAVVCELQPADATADMSPLLATVPSFRDLDAQTPPVRASVQNFKVAPTFMPAVLEQEDDDDVLVGRHTRSPWSMAIDQPVESHKTRKRESVEMIAREIGPVPPTGKGLVLLVEDDAASRNALSTILRRRGWRVESAGTLSEGMRLLDTHPDRVIVDLMLPDGDGGKIVQRLKSTGLSSRVTVMTGVSDPARLAKIKAMGPGAVLQKPVSVSALLHDLAASAPAAAA